MHPSPKIVILTVIATIKNDYVNEIFYLFRKRFHPVCNGKWMKGRLASLKELFQSQLKCLSSFRKKVLKSKNFPMASESITTPFFPYQTICFTTHQEGLRNPQQLHQYIPTFLLWRKPRPVILCPTIYYDHFNFAGFCQPVLHSAVGRNGFSFNLVKLSLRCLSPLNFTEVLALWHLISFDLLPPGIWLNVYWFN